MSDTTITALPASSFPTMNTGAMNGIANRQAITAAIERVRAARRGDLPPLPDQLPHSSINSTTSNQPNPRERSEDELIDERQKEQKENELPEIEDTVDFLAKPLEKPKVLIQGLLHKGSKMILGSGSKSFKTWTLLDLVMSVASGVPWLGIDTVKGKVLFVNFELKDVGIQSRIAAIRKERNLSWEKGSLDILNLRGFAAPYNTIIPKILDKVKNKEYDMIILDPVYKLYGDTDENSAGDVAKLMNEFEKLAVKSKAAVVFSAHFSKGNQAGKESIDRVSGSGVFGRDPDSIVSFTAHEEPDAFVIETKLRDFKEMEPFVVKWAYPVMVPDTCLNPEKLKTGISKEAIYTVDQLRRILAVQSLTKKDLKAAAMHETGMGETTFNNLFRKLETVEGFTFDSKTQKYSYVNPNGAGLVGKEIL